MRKYRSIPTRSYSARRSGKKAQRNLILSLLLGIFLIYVLFIWVLPNLIGGLSVLTKAKNPIQTQTKVSENSTLAPPVLNIPYEATNTATIRVRGYATPNTKVEIFLDGDLKSTVTSQDNGSFTSDNISLSLGTNNIYGKTIDDKDIESLASKTIQVTYSNTKPKLQVDQPPDGQVVHGGDKKVTVSGSTDPQDTIYINDNQVIVGDGGKFSSTININDGDNNIIIKAADSIGNTTQITRKVTYQPS
ncbi:hypothetical protein HY389_02580 [Candidatus Daviesbacteria bacterium]|nr:hypothetical protein [Candidatus Daviesbacteria bacterium]